MPISYDSWTVNKNNISQQDVFEVPADCLLDPGGEVAQVGVEPGQMPPATDPVAD